MTCIVGVVHADGVFIGGDSAGVAGMDLALRADGKVFKSGEFVMGFTSSYRMGQLLRYVFTPPKRHPDKDVMAYMVTDFVGAVRECLKAGGFATKTNEAEQGGSFLVGYSGRLFAVHSDYQVAETACGYDAVGCGDQIARGALFANSSLKPHERIKQALAAAEAWSAGVRGPFHIETV